MEDKENMATPCASGDSLRPTRSAKEKKRKREYGSSIRTSWENRLERYSCLDQNCL